VTEERARELVDGAERQLASVIAERDNLRTALQQCVEALDDANQACQSTYQVAARGGVETNWPALTTRLGELLSRQLIALVAARKLLEEK
jgi:replicative DNA helicase